MNPFGRSKSMPRFRYPIPAIVISDHCPLNLIWIKKPARHVPFHRNSADHSNDLALRFRNAMPLF